MNDEIKEILDIFTKYKDDWYSVEYILKPKQCVALYDYITNLQQENERLNQNQVKVLNRIRDFIYSSKCEITEGSYCDDKHSQYWKMFKKFAEEVQDKIKGLDIEDYVYIPKWREQELLSQEEQLEDYKSRIEKAVEYIEHSKFIKEQVIMRSNYDMQDFQIRELLNILNGKGSDE